MIDTPVPFNIDDEAEPVFGAVTRLKMLIYGDPKVGKTTFAATAPNPVLYYNEPGWVVLIKNEENRKKFAHVKRTPCYDLKRLEEIVTGFRLGQGAGIETVILDTLTEFEDRTLNAYMKYAMARGLTKNENEYNPEWPEYKAVTAILKKAMIEFRDIDKHVIVLCHCRDDADKRRGGMNVDRPALMPKLGSSLEGMFNLIGYMFVDHDGVYKMRVIPTPNIVAGNHIWSGEAIIENPTFDMFLKGLGS